MIVVILVIGFLLRILNLNQSLWLDEAINVVSVSKLNYYDLVTKYALGDFHPPLFHPILKFWISIFGNSEISVRMPSVLFGVGAIYVTYLIAREVASKKLAYLAAFFMAIAPYEIYFSQEARMYSMEGFLGLLTGYLFLKILKEEKFLYFLGFTLLMILAVYVDYFGFFLPLIYIFYCVYEKKIGLLKKIFVSFGVTFIVWLLWLPFFIKQFANAVETTKSLPGWAAVVGDNSIKNFLLTFVKFSIGRIHFDNKVLYGLFVLPILVLFGYLSILGFKYIKRKWSTYLAIFFWLPVVVSFLISFFYPIYQPFRLLYVLPILYIFLAGGVLSFGGVKRKVLFLLVGLVCLGGVFIYNYFPRYHREDWRSAVAAVEEIEEGGDLVVFTSYEVMKPWIYYQKGGIEGVGSSEYEKIDGAKRVFLVRYLWPVFDPEDKVRGRVEDEFLLVDEKDFNGVFWQLYVRDEKN